MERAPSDFAEGLLNSHARPEGNGEVVITSTEADQGNLVPMELMKRILQAKGSPAAGTIPTNLPKPDAGQV